MRWPALRRRYRREGARAGAVPVELGYVGGRENRLPIAYLPERSTEAEALFVRRWMEDIRGGDRAVSVNGADPVARLLARREAIDHELDAAVREREGDAIEQVRVPRWLTAVARALPSRARLMLARDYAFREASVARRRQAELEADLLRLRGTLGSVVLSPTQSLDLARLIGGRVNYVGADLTIEALGSGAVRVQQGAGRHVWEIPARRHARDGGAGSPRQLGDPAHEGA